jgi:hypothetical protein
MRLYYNKMMTENVLNSDMRASLMTISDDSSHRESGSTAMVDLEKQELKSILKKPYKERPYAVHIIKYMISFVTFLLCFPIVICDMYYGYSKDSCVEEYPAKLNINMKIYLVVGAYANMLIMVLVICSISCLSRRNSRSMHLYMVTVPKLIVTYGSLFLLAWNIIGSVIFWGMLYNKNLCSSNISTYLFVTLVVKLVCNLTVLCSRK